jgi:UDP-N-acetylmuramoylalanine--D-glutamate ligase
MKDRVTCVIAYGDAAGIVESDLSAHVMVERVDGAFEQVVDRAASIARPGDAVLLSPACASFDMFRDYEQRGNTFKELVQRLAGAAS